MIVGSEEALKPSPYAREIMNGVAGAQLVILEGRAMSWSSRSSEAVNDDLLAFYKFYASCETLIPIMTTRRDFLLGAAVFLASPLDVLAEDCAVTSRAIQGPYWRPDAPFTTDIRRKGGEELLVRGVLRDRRCAPIANAVIDVWQADHLGKYDLDYSAAQSFGRARLRTDARGQYELRTIKPAPYGMRPAHIHFLIGTKLVTQLYFAGDRYLASDPLRAVRPDLVKEVRKGEVSFDITLS